MLQMIPIRVECYSGSRADEQPRFLLFGDQRLEVEEVVDRWYHGGTDPSDRQAEYFKLRAGPAVYLVMRDIASHAWFLVSERTVN